MRLRRFRRAVALGFEILCCVIRFWLLRLDGPRTLERRAQWVQHSAQRIIRCLGIECTVEGQPPASGLVVANHLSYLDILALSAAMPCFFVSKVEVGGWPFFGRAARSGGTIFLDRASVASAHRVAAEMTKRFKMPIAVPVLLFPEGTSTDGSKVLRFHSRLIDPAVAMGAPVTAAAVRYVIHDGTPERELCWYDDATFTGHLWKVLGVAGFEAEVRFGEPRIYADRREAADQTRTEIVGMREAMVQLLAASS
jgi:1-acyl-sn-glycerol-3-phosphate acyltransferase